MINNAYIKKAKKDILDFFVADSLDKTHWVYNYTEKHSNLDKIQWNSTSVFWYKQLAVLFEDKHLHSHTTSAINELVREGELKIITEHSSIIRSFLPQVSSIKLVYHKSNKQYKPRAKEVLELLKTWWIPSYAQGIGDYGEIAAELTFTRLGFKIEDEHTNEFNGKKYTKTDKNLDFIISKEEIFYGIEVKNTISYPKRDEFEEKTYSLCEELGLIPWWICRNVPKKWFIEVKNNSEGSIFINKRLIFPTISKIQARKIWDATGIPTTTQKRFTAKVQKRIEKEHDRVKKLFM